MNQRTCLLSAAACSIVLLLGGISPAHAEGFYAGVQGGATFFNDDYTRVVIPPAPTIGSHTNFDVGWLAGASAGYELPLGFALEEEFTFRESHIDRVATTGGPLLTGGDAHSYSIMTNGYYGWHNSTPFTPYIGGGVGESTVVLNNLRPAFGTGTGNYGGDDAVFAYQGIAGVSYAFSPRLSLAAEYRYFATLRPGFTANVGGADNVKVAPDYTSQNVLLRLTYNFDSAK
ncbi:MAG TPA: outer membrane beta-barrel protein [Candidatus Binataceae bacterium]|nr:outer membrane beta-barrel protein [Candidatus Binataceae bacterium]